MIAREVIAFIALAGAFAQPASIWVDVAPTTTEDPGYEDVERRYTPELIQELETTKADALLLYTEFSARASQSLKQFIRNVSRLEVEAVGDLNVTDPGLISSAPEHCRSTFLKRIKKIEYNAHRAATFSGENHHKFFLGHMVVFRMHLNKSEDYVRRADKVFKTCGFACETTTKMKRYRRQALDEIHRVRDDIQHSRRMYRDLLTHAQRRLHKLRRNAASDIVQAVAVLRQCSRE